MLFRPTTRQARSTPPHTLTPFFVTQHSLQQRSRSVLILRVLPCGEFVKERHIGRNCYEDDALFLHMHSQQSGDEAGALANGDSPILPSLTHRMLAYAFHACCGGAVVGAGAVKAWGCGGPEGLPFHAVFPVIMRLQLKRVGWHCPKGDGGVGRIGRCVSGAQGRMELVACAARNPKPPSPPHPPRRTPTLPPAGHAGGGRQAGAVLAGPAGPCLRAARQLARAALGGRV